MTHYIIMTNNLPSMVMTHPRPTGRGYRETAPTWSTNLSDARVFTSKAAATRSFHSFDTMVTASPTQVTLKVQGYEPHYDINTMPNIAQFPHQLDTWPEGWSFSNGVIMQTVKDIHGTEHQFRWDSPYLDERSTHRFLGMKI